MALPNWRDYIIDQVISPNHYGPMTAHDGVVVHATRGGQMYGVEYQATINWFMLPTSQASAHLCIGIDGRIATFMPLTELDRQMWHASQYNCCWFGVELEGPYYESIFTDIQYRLLASYILEMHNLYGFNLDRGAIIGHDEVPGSGKTDPGPGFEWDRLMALFQPEPPVCPPGSHWDGVQCVPDVPGDNGGTIGAGGGGGLMLLGGGLLLAGAGYLIWKG